MPNLTHFHQAQSPIYDTALAELRAGQKRSHWMWFWPSRIALRAFAAQISPPD